MDGTALLTLSDVAIERGGVRLAAGLSFRLAAGDAIVLRGPNGSGKTTLLRTIAGLQPAAAGDIHAEADSIAYGGHADGLKSTLTVCENLVFWASVYGTRDIAPALDAFGLTDLGDRMAGNLSAGQKRRLGLARLLVTGREIWALDEPTVSLDAASTALFAKSVGAHLAKGGAAIMATHIDLGLEARVIDMTGFPPPAAEATGVFDEALS